MGEGGRGEVTVIRWIIAVPLGGLFLVVAAANCGVVAAMVKERLHWWRGGDLHGVRAMGCCLPGALAGVIAVLLCPIPRSDIWVWVPLVIDPALLPRLILLPTLEVPWHSNDSRPPLQAAAAEGDAAVVLRHLAAGDDPNRFYVWTPLHYAAGAGATEMVDLLLRHGADPSLADYRGRTPADVAEMAGHQHLAVSLRHAECDPSRYGAPLPPEEALVKLIEATEGGEWCQDVLLAVPRPEGREVAIVSLAGDGNRVECNVRWPWQDAEAPPTPAMARMVGETKGFGGIVLIDGEARQLGPERWPVSFEPKTARWLPMREGLPLEFSDLYRIDRTARDPDDVTKLLGSLHDATIADEAVDWDAEREMVTFEARRTAFIPKMPDGRPSGRRAFVTIRGVSSLKWDEPSEHQYAGQFEEARVEENAGRELLLDFVAAHARLQIRAINVHVRDTTELSWPRPEAGPKLLESSSNPPDEMVLPL